MNKHAILSSTSEGMRVMWIEDGKFVRRDIPALHSLSAVAEMAYPFFITHLWVMPGIGPFENLPCKEWRFLPRHRGKQIMEFTAKKNHHKLKDCEIIFTEVTSWWERFMNQCDEQEILITLHYLERQVETGVSASPGHSGWVFLKHIHEKWVEPVLFDLHGNHFTGHATGDIIWNRQVFTEADRNAVYIHKFDVGSAYPYAATQTALGVGVPIKSPGSDALLLGSQQPIGVWPCDVLFGEYDPMLPPRWKENQRQELKGAWLSGPIIRLILSNPHNSITVGEGWKFPEKHLLLAKWANDLFDARRAFKSLVWVNRKCAGYAESAIKQILVETIGLTAYGQFEDGSEMKRPDIRMQVIARHRELFWHRLNAFYRLQGRAPILVYMDAAYYLSTEHNILPAFRELVGRTNPSTGVYKDRQQVLGGMKYEGSIAMNKYTEYSFPGRKGTPPFDGLVDDLILGDYEYSTAQKIEVLNEIGWTK